MNNSLPTKGQRGFQKVLEVVDGKRACGKCGELKDISLFGVREQKYRGSCKACLNTKARTKWREVKARIFDHYGWRCVCCGETIREFLTLDHVNNDGYKDKNPNGDKKSGKELFLLVIKQGFPSKYQTLCCNCNWGKKVCGLCPHQKVV